MTKRAFCIHGHFYQPPREDPLTGIIPKESGAAPFANWNERIHAECYQPNSKLRNFEGISFNIGPTLANWIDMHDPVTWREIVVQDKINVSRHGVGNAMAQAYNHTILPLASYQDKTTQVYWGIADFIHRFGRQPQGMWLPETAADTETLDVLARYGIRYTILAPWQAEGGDLDTSEPYIFTPSKQREVTVFFYQSDLSALVSFDPKATVDADLFVREFLLRSYRPAQSKGDEPQLILIASDGELYGHHQSLRDHFLAHLVDGASSQAALQATYPGLWIKDHPARRSVSIRENTSWSCHHGVTRWAGACECSPGKAIWKGKLREAMDLAAAELDQLYIETAGYLFDDPWALRKRYIHVMLGQTKLESLLSEMLHWAPTSQQTRRIHLMLEAQRERQRMFTSCGWFFDDFDRIEPRNNVAYAAQAVYLARLATGVDISPLVIPALKQVISPITGLSADRVFEKHLQRAEEVNKQSTGKVN